MRFSQARLKHSRLTLIQRCPRLSEQREDTDIWISTNNRGNRSLQEAFILIFFFIKAQNEVTLKSDLMQIGCNRAVCIFHFSACVISCSPFLVTEETEEKQCIHIALGSRRPGRSTINQSSVNTAHNVHPALIFKAVDSCNEQSIPTKRRKMQRQNVLNNLLELARFPPFLSARVCILIHEAFPGFSTPRRPPM